MKGENSQKKKRAVAQMQRAWCPICLSELSDSKECPRHGLMRRFLDEDPKGAAPLALQVDLSLEAAQHA